MYLTFFTKAQPQQVTFDDILKDPYMSLTNLPKVPQKKVTVEVTEEYARDLYNRTTKLNLTYSDEYYTDILRNLDTSQHYRHFTIPKKSNPHKKRQIDAPDGILSNIQTTYKTILEDGYHILPHKAAHAYVAERSTITAMKRHQKNESKWFLQIDLKDFFPSIGEEFMRRMLNEVYPFRFIPKHTLDNIIKASLLNGSLPQGSHLSPTLTNMVMVPIDHDLTETLHNFKRHHYVYTRYADDITISCKEKFDPKVIINVIKSIFNKWNVPFRINDSKTRFGSSAGRNYHVGLIINKDNQISVGHEKNKKFRAMLFNFCTTKDEWNIESIRRMLGIISYYKSIEPEFIIKTLNKYNKKFNTDIESEAKRIINGINFTVPEQNINKNIKLDTSGEIPW